MVCVIATGKESKRESCSWVRAIERYRDGERERPAFGERGDDLADGRRESKGEDLAASLQREEMRLESIERVGLLSSIPLVTMIYFFPRNACQAGFPRKNSDKVRNFNSTLNLHVVVTQKIRPRRTS